MECTRYCWNARGEIYLNLVLLSDPLHPVTLLTGSLPEPLGTDIHLFLLCRHHGASWGRQLLQDTIHANMVLFNCNKLTSPACDNNNNLPDMAPHIRGETYALWDLKPRSLSHAKCTFFSRQIFGGSLLPDVGRSREVAQNDRRQPADILSYFLAPTDTGK